MASVQMTFPVRCRHGRSSQRSTGNNGEEAAALRGEKQRRVVAGRSQDEVAIVLIEPPDQSCRDTVEAEKVPAPLQLFDQRSGGVNPARQRPRRAPKLTHQRRRVLVVAGYVSDHEPGSPARQNHEIVEIATYFQPPGTRQVPGVDLQARQVRKATRQKAPLQNVGGAQGGVVPAGVVHHRCHLLRQPFGEGDVVRFETAGRRHDRDRAQDLATGEEGNDEIGTESQLLDQRKMVGVVRGLAKEVVAHFLRPARSAGSDHVDDRVPAPSIGWVATAQSVNQRLPDRVAVERDHPYDLALVIDDIDEADVAEGGQ